MAAQPPQFLRQVGSKSTVLNFRLFFTWPTLTSKAVFAHNFSDRSLKLIVESGENNINLVTVLLGDSKVCPRSNQIHLNISLIVTCVLCLCKLTVIPSSLKCHVLMCPYSPCTVIAPHRLLTSRFDFRESLTTFPTFHHMEACTLNSFFSCWLSTRVVY